MTYSIDLRTVSFCIALALLSLLPGIVVAHGEGGDAFITNLDNTKVGVGGAPGVDDGDFSQLDLVNRVWGTELIPGFPTAGDFGNDEPGFFALDVDETDYFPPGSEALPQASGSVSLEIETFTVGGDTSNLFYWDVLSDGDTETVEFSQAPAGVSFAILGTTITPDANTTLADFDHHPVLSIDDGMTATTAPDGLYLVSLTATFPGLDDSDPFYIVLGTEDSAEDDGALEDLIDSAVEWVEHEFVVPEPATLALLLCGVVLASLKTSFLRRVHHAT